MNFLERAENDRIVELTADGSRQKIRYVAANVTGRLTDPEEQVRARFWAELVYHYGYEHQRIGVEVSVPDRKPADRADLVVFRDDRRTRPYAVFECKPDDISDAEFEQAVEQACGNGTWAKFRAEYVGVVAGDGPDDPVLPGGSTYATVRFAYEPEVCYDALVVGAQFEVLEGSRVVAIGQVTRR
jgi:type I restriction enzyme M protein